MNDETLQVIARIPDDVLEWLTSGDWNDCKYRKYVSMGRYSSALVVALYHTKFAATEERHIDTSDEEGLSDENLAQVVYVLQPEEMEPLGETELVALFYAYCGALLEAEMTTYSNPRGVMAVADLLLALEVIEEIPAFERRELFDVYYHVIPEWPPNVPMSPWEGDVKFVLGYEFTSPNLLTSIVSSYHRNLSNLGYGLRRIGRAFVQYVAAMHGRPPLYCSTDEVLARYAMAYGLNRGFICSTFHWSALRRAIQLYAHQLSEHPDDDLTKRATREIGTSMVALIGAVFVDSDFISTVEFVTHLMMRFPPPNPPPPPPRYIPHW